MAAAQSASLVLVTLLAVFATAGCFGDSGGNKAGLLAPDNAVSQDDSFGRYLHAQDARSLVSGGNVQAGNSRLTNAKNGPVHQRNMDNNRAGTNVGGGTSNAEGNTVSQSDTFVRKLHIKVARSLAAVSGGTANGGRSKIINSGTATNNGVVVPPNVQNVGGKSAPGGVGTSSNVGGNTGTQGGPITGR